MPAPLAYFAWAGSDNDRPCLCWLQPWLPQAFVLSCTRTFLVWTSWRFSPVGCAAIVGVELCPVMLFRRARPGRGEQLQRDLCLWRGQMDQAGLLAATRWPRAKIKVAVNACHEPRAVARPQGPQPVIFSGLHHASRDSLRVRFPQPHLHRPLAAWAAPPLMPALPVPTPASACR